MSDKLQFVVTAQRLPLRERDKLKFVGQHAAVGALQIFASPALHSPLNKWHRLKSVMISLVSQTEVCATLMASADEQIQPANQSRVPGCPFSISHLRLAAAACGV